MRWLAGIAAVVALGAAGCGGTVGTSAGSAEIIPATAPAYVAVNLDTDSPQWRTLDELSSRFPDKQQAMQTFREAVRNEGFSWKQDIEPALGPEIDFVWMDFENDGEDVVVLLRPDDDEKFERLIAKVDDSADFFHAKVGEWQAMSPHRDVLDRFRSESGSGDTLAEREPFVDAVDGYPDGFLVRAYVDGAAVMKAVGKDPDPDVQRILPKLGRLDWVATDLRATSEGIRWDFNAHGTPGPALKGLSPTRPFRPGLAREVPKDALAYFSFHGARGALTGLKNNPVFADVPELRRYSGVLRRVESLLQGENALWVRPSRTGKIPEVTFVTEPAPGTDGAAMLDRLIARYRKQLELPAPPLRTHVAGVPARVVLADPVQVYYANVGKRLVLTTEPAGIKALKGTPPSIAQSGDYRDTLDASGMPERTQGFVYVNVKGGMRYAQRLAQVPLPGQVKRNLSPLRSVVEYAATRPSEVQVTFFLRIE